MGIVKGADLHEWTFNHKFPGRFTMDAPIINKQYQVEPPNSGKSDSIQFAFGEVLISYTQVVIDRPVRLQREKKGDCIEMFFALKGKATFTINNEQQYNFAENQHNIYYGYGSKEAIELLSTQEPLEFLAIDLSRPYYLRLLHQGGILQRRFIDRITHNQPGFLRDENFTLTPAMMLIIEEIRDCRKTGTVKRIFLEAKVLELLMLQTEQLEQQHEQDYSTFDLNLLEEARQILEQNIATPLTISSLAKLVGINESQLKKGFKETYGITVFGYANQLKMQLARHLLLAKDKSVSETAFLVGYKNPQHFTVAFKRHYNILPSQLKKA
uniref:AraC family transcriptional regulator n=1 Tax=Roseihalotalea indica TaxID=2867963 RepID=A0AA49JIG5_9BACT|nr:AraC family transcriptional regulator [Tunicatimonas sp. TK19036]